jgi:predicted nucleic-acid-binding Zn-ribbon protein
LLPNPSEIPASLETHNCDWSIVQTRAGAIQIGAIENSSVTTSTTDRQTARSFPFLDLITISRGNYMTCKSCRSENLRKFTGEIAIHFRGLRNINKPHVWVFPELVVCLNCGFAEFAVPETELRLLTKGRVASAG